MLKNNIAVLHLFNSIEYSGAEMMLLSSKDLAWQANIEYSYLSTGKFKGKLAEDLTAYDYQVYHLPYSITIKHFFYFYKLLRNKRYDVLHIHKEKAFFYYALIAKIAGVNKLFRTLHSSYRHNKYKRIVYRFFARVFLKVKFISISESVRENELNNFNNKTILIRNWYDNSRFNLKVREKKNNYREKFNLSKNVKVILSVGSCIRLKRHEDIIKALSIVKNSFDNFIYIHIGDGPENKNEKDLVQELDLNNYVLFITKSANIEEYYSMADLYLMTSEVEGLGIAAIESMACGLPVILYDVPGLRDLLINKKAKQFLIQASYKELAKKIIEIFKMDEIQLNDIIKTNYDLVSSNYNITSSMKKIISLYKDKEI